MQAPDFLCACVESVLEGMHIRPMSSRLSSPDTGCPKQAAGGQHPCRDEHQGRRLSRSARSAAAMLHTEASPSTYVSENSDGFRT